MPKNSHKRRSVEAWQQILTEFDQSGQPQKAFCQERGIALSTFGKWRTALRADDRKNQKMTKEPLFVELPIDHGPKNGGRNWDIELDLGNGIALRLRAA